MIDYEGFKEYGGRKYKILDGTYYHNETPDRVVQILHNTRIDRDRLRLYYGDIKTGRDWEEIYGVTGYIGRSNGWLSVPLLVYNKRCLGGDCVLDDCIVKIETARGKRELYKHPNYHKEGPE